MTKDFKPGDRVELSPSTDRWMRGDRYGEIVNVGRIHGRVKLDRSGQIRPFNFRLLTLVTR